MAKGHIQLGLTSDEMNEFLLVDPTQRIRSRFNPLGPKIGQGSTQFNDYTAHEYWEISLWNKGIGYNADVGVEGGYLYGEVDSRAGEEFILPPLLSTYTAEDNADISPSVTNIDSGFIVKVLPPGKIAIQFYMDVPGNIYVFINTQGVVSASIYSDVANEPGVELWSGNANSNPATMTAEWTLIDNDFTPVAGTPYWLVLEDTDNEICVHAMTSTDGAGKTLKDVSGSWEDLVNLQTTYIPYMAGSGQLGNIVSAETVGSNLFTLSSAGVIYKWNNTTDTFDSFADTGTTATDMQLWFGNLIVGHGSLAVMDSVDATSGAITPLSHNATLFTVWNGYLWRAYNNIASYAGSDTSLWIDVECGPDDYVIRGMAGLGDDIIASTDQAIWRIAPGDWVFGVTKWAYQSPNNGINMISNQGAAFIPADNTLVRMQTNAPLRNIWKRDESLPDDKAGIIAGVIGTNKEVIIYIDPADAGGIATLWSFNNQGWHHVAKLPANQTITYLHYDNSNDSIWIFSDSGHAYSFYASSTASNPTTDSLTTFHPAGWVDMGNFHGGLQTIVKDFDSVRVIGDNISPEKPVTIYWRDPSSFEEEYIYGTDDTIMLDTAGNFMLELQGGWSTLGEIVETGQDLRWTDHTVRPVGYGIRLAYSIASNNINVTPEVYAVVVKYHSHIVDQFRWQLPIIVSNEQEMTDGERDSRTTQVLMDQLEALEIDRYLPIFFTDVDGRQWECKVISFAERIIKYEKTLAEPDIHYVVDLGLQETAPYA